MKCKCGSESFAIIIREHSTQKGLYCAKCGKWQKWLGKNEYNLMLIKGLKETRV